MLPCVRYHYSKDREESLPIDKYLPILYKITANYLRFATGHQLVAYLKKCLQGNGYIYFTGAGMIF